LRLVVSASSLIMSVLWKRSVIGDISRADEEVVKSIL
jgi:hypothetical protein